MNEHEHRNLVIFCVSKCCGWSGDVKIQTPVFVALGGGQDGVILPWRLIPKGNGFQRNSGTKWAVFGRESQLAGSPKAQGCANVPGLSRIKRLRGQSVVHSTLPKTSWDGSVRYAAELYNILPAFQANKRTKGLMLKIISSHIE